MDKTPRTTAQLVEELQTLRQQVMALQTREAELRQAGEALRQSEAMFFELAPDAMVVVNHQGHIARVNAQAERLFGYNREELLGQPVEVLLPERSQEAHVHHRTDYCSHPRLRPMGAGIELYGRRKEGNELPVDIMLSPVATSDGLLVISVIRDNTERKQTEEQLRRQHAELAARNRIFSTILRTNDLQERLKNILTEVLALLRVEYGCIHFLQDDKLVLTCWQGISDDLRAQVLSFPADTSLRWLREPLVVHEKLSEAGRMPDFVKREGIQACASLLLRLPPRREGEAGQWFGTLLVGSRHIEALSEQEMRQLEAMGDHLALAIDHARSQRQAEERLVRLQTLHEIDRAIVQQHDLQQVLHTVLGRIPRELGADAAAISLLDEGQTQTKVFVVRLPNGTVLEEEIFTLADALLHWLVERKEHVIIYDLTQDPRVQMHREAIRSQRLISYLGVPLVVQEKTIGVLHLLTTQPRVFADEALAFFRTLAGQAAIAIENLRISEGLRQSEERFRALIERSSDAIMLLDREGTLLYASPATTRILGYTPDEVPGRSGFALVHPDELHDATVLFAHLLQQPDDTVRAEIRLRHKDGSWRWVEGTGTNLLGHPVVRAVVANYRDVTERKQTGERLRQAEEKYRSIFENAIEGIFQTTPDGHFLSANPAMAHILGYESPAELMMSCPDIGQQLYVEPARRLELQRLLDVYGTVQGFEVRGYRKDGSVIWVSLTSRAVRDANGTLRYYEGIMEDVTKRKQAETALQEEVQVSAALARMGQALIASLDKPVILDRLCQLTTEVMGCDQSSTVLWQPEERVYVLAAAYGHSVERLEILRALKITPQDVAGLIAHLEGQEVVEVETAASQHLLSASLLRQLGVTATLYLALRRGNELIGFQTAAYRERTGFSPTQKRIARGIGQLASLALENARLLEQAERADRLKSDFLATMSHELRTPLNIAMGYTDLLLEEVGGVLTAEQAKFLQRIRMAANEEFELITNMLDVSRLEAGRLPVERAEVNVTELLTELQEETERDLQKPGLRFMRRIAPELPSLYTDRTKLKAVLKNLLSNAVKFTEQGSITVEVQPREGGVEFCVVDTGIGITPDVQAVMFEMFRQGDSSTTRRFGGVGLGLYVVRQLLGLLGGTVTVESEVGRSSTFRVWVPTRR